MEVLVTGAARGIGLELVRILSERGDQVWAVCRKPSPELSKLKVNLIQADINGPELEEILQNRLKDVKQLDLLINNAGIGEEMSTPLERLDVDRVRAMLETNAIGPLRVTRCLLPQLKKSPRAKVAHISSLMGSIRDNEGGQAYGYRMSKAALNAMNKSLAIDEPSLLTVVLHPGWVQTDMGGQQAPVKPVQSAQGLIEVIDQLKNSGHFYDYKGRELPW